MFEEAEVEDVEGAKEAAATKLADCAAEVPEEEVGEDEITDAGGQGSQLY